MVSEPHIEILRQLVELPTLLFLFLFFGFLLRLRVHRTGEAVIVVAIAMIYLAATPIVGATLLRTLVQEATELPGQSSTRTPEAIVVLSANAYVANSGALKVGHLTLERLRRGAELHRDTGLPVLVSGGVINDYPEAIATAMAKSLAEDFRIGPVWQEVRSRTTAENAQFSAELLSEKGIATVALVTHAWHMPRAALSFRHFGIIAVPYPVDPGRTTTSQKRLFQFLPSASGLYASQLACHEWIGRIWYRLFVL